MKDYRRAAFILKYGTATRGSEETSHFLPYLYLCLYILDFQNIIWIK